MAQIREGEKIIDVEMSMKDLVYAMKFLIKERERAKLFGRKQRAAKLENPEPKEPKEPKVRKEPKKYYVPTGRPRGRPRKNPLPPAPEVSEAAAPPADP